MEKSEIVKLWDGSNNSLPPLIKTNLNNQTVALNTSSSAIQKKEEEKEDAKDVDLSILNKSILSADAKEWFPSNYNTGVYQIQEGFRSMGINEGEERGNDGNDGVLEQNELNSDPVMDTIQLKDMISTLILDPGRFDDIVHLFLDLLGPYSNKLDVCNSVAELLFKTALSEPNFRYNSARLCTVAQEVHPLIRTKLHLLCEEELNSPNPKQGLTLFLAELYTQLNSGNIYMKSLLRAIRCLLSDGNPENIKCVCQTLKLCGCSLDKEDKKEIDDIFSQLQASRRSLPERISTILDSVVSLRNRDWDQNLAPSSSSNEHLQNGFTSNYNQYLYNHGDFNQEENDDFRSIEDLFIEDYDPDDLYDPEPEMDEEIQAAFKEFVKKSKR